ncbi:hypothetical protein BP5796_08290 [Coleophoma crateriformis]|uniref:Uncharacterized protein n=1 Tax=Coleophoma crateriformis TaxID=565419 RepID=A0A3D8R772_9HELO|nr:hypothetical protein BP5796_08290 [Coleophoma crateriformis]
MPWAVTADEVASGLTVVIALLAIPSIRTLAKDGWRVKSPHRAGAMYEDVDGAATPASIAEFTNTPQLIAIFALALLGLAISIADAIFTAVQEGFQIGQPGIPILSLFLLVGAWVLLLVQLIATTREVEFVPRFHSAISRITTCILIAIIAWVALLGDDDRNSQSYTKRMLATSILTSAQIAAAVALFAAIFSVRRRPAVFRPDGKIVDRQMNVSLWSRYSFQWCVDVLRNAGKDKFENEDLPAMDHVVRSENATASFRNMVLKEDSLPLWVQIFWQFRWQLIWQWSAILFSNFFDVAPAFATLQLLRYLEAREDADAIDPMAWKYVIGIVVATMSSHLVDSRIMWLVMSDIVIPLRSVLNGLMYAKMLKIKDSSEPLEETEKEKDGTTDDQGKDEKKKAAKSQQDIVNMFAVDCNQIAIFGAQNTQYINSAGKLIVTVVFLLLLIGWESLCAGMVGILVLFPINKALAERYGQKQKALMKIRDTRTTIITEALQGIRQIKFSAIEKQWTEKISKVREEELSMLWKTRVNNLYMSVASEFTPIVLTALSLATYSYIHGNLLPSVAFTAISLFLQLEGLVSHIPFLMVAAINAKVSADRIEKFLRLPEKGENTHPGESVSFHNVSVTFPHDSEHPREDRFTLRDLNLSFPNNSLSIISGPTGSGKSLLLAAILGEVEVLSGYIQVPRAPPADQRFDNKATAADWIIPTAMAFISQTPWIENATIKDNILFGLPFDPVRYEKVVQACALSQDLEIFEDGDQTEVGAQGISLSGGQKWRLTLARAFYSRAGIIIMDDVFSALDAHVGRHIYDNAVMGELAEGRTRILVTHHVSLCLPRAKYAVRLSARGTLEHAGLTQELQKSGSLEDILDTDKPTEADHIEEDEVLKRVATNGSVAIPSNDVAVAVKAPPKKLVEEEKREVGRVKTSVYAGYLNASGGWPFWLFLVILYAIAEALKLGRTYWIRIWASAYGESEESQLHAVAQHYSATLQTHFYTPPVNATNFANTSLPIETNSRGLWFYLGIYVFISTISVVMSIGRLYNIYTGSIRASRRIFNDMLHSVLRAPLRWLDTVPTGRILNRFTGDFTSLDSSLAQTFYYFAGITWEIIGILGAAVFVSPYMILCALALLTACAMFARSYIAAARNVKRLESTNKSPCISHFSVSLAGLSTIRAFAKTSEFGDRMFNLVDTYAACAWHNSLFRSWLMIRIGFTASLFSAAVAAFVITTRGIDASLAGFALSFALSFGHSVSWAISISTQLELDMNATERIFEYRDLEIENQDGEDVRASWPENGKVEVKDLEVGYAEGLPSILKGLTFTAEMNQRIGVVGRTGAGKSTLSLALFRFLQIRNGNITIDGVDISKIKLHDLRTRLAIIPQDPVLFSGTIRSNLDPFDEFSDVQVREALMRVHLIPSGTGTPFPETAQIESSTASSTTAIEPVGNTNIFLSLSSPIAAGGSNLSQGQKQLLCLARAILSRPKVLLLDEATSAVDMATDILIQRSIREEFANTTLLVVAHRLSTVADFDKILVMKDGVTAEFGSPKELIEIEDGIFNGMVKQSGESEALESIMNSN